MSFTTPMHVRSGPTLPLAAMVDILFLLLVFFLTIASLHEQDRLIEVSLPGPAGADSSTSRTPIIVTISADGGTYLGDEEYALQELQQRLATHAAQFPDERVDLRGDRACSHGDVMAVLRAVRSAGLRNVGIHLHSPSPDGSD